MTMNMLSENVHDYKYVIRNCTIYVAKTKALISCAVTYAAKNKSAADLTHCSKSKFSHIMVQTVVDHNFAGLQLSKEEILYM